MKRTIATMLILTLCVVGAFAGEGNVQFWQPFASQSISTNCSVTSSTWSASSVVEGNWSVQLKATGPGSLTNITLEASNNGSDFTRPMLSTGSRMGYISSSFTTNSGTSSNGIDLIQIAPPIAMYYRITASEAAAGMSTVSVWIAVQ